MPSRGLTLWVLFALLPSSRAHGHFDEAEVIDAIKNGKVDAIVDLRTVEEWAEGHIPGAFEVNFDMTVS